MIANEKMVMVPLEPTDEMIVAFAEAWYSKRQAIDDPDMLDAYRAMLAAAPSQLGQGEPVAWMDPRSPRMHATISNEVKQHNVKFGGAPASAVNGYTIPLYTHAEVERMRSIERMHDLREALLQQVKGERDRMIDRACDLSSQLAEAQVLLRRCSDVFEAVDLGSRVREAISQFLSASAEPSAPVEIDERASYEKAVIDSSERFHPNLEQYGGHPEAEYRDSSIEWAWGLWQARAALERKS